MRNDAPSGRLGVYAKAEKVTSHELQEANKAALDEKAITEPIEKKERPEDTTQKSGSPKSDGADNFAGHSEAPCASRRGYDELAFGDGPTHFGFRHKSGAAIEG